MSEHPGSHPHATGAAGKPFHPNEAKPAYVHDPRDATGINPDEVNARSNFSMHCVFVREIPLPADEEAVQGLITDLEETLGGLDVEIRGTYDVAGFRAEADLMFWLVSESADALQAAYHAIIASELGRYLAPVWSAVAAHMAAEFNARHLPACFGGVVPRPYIAVYPFVRSYDWYYLPPARRAAVLKEHGMNGRDYLDVQVSTLAAFALGDYEWVISLEGDSYERIMGVLRQQRDSEARLFVREDTPFFTGPLVSLSQWVSRQPTE